MAAKSPKFNFNEKLYHDVWEQVLGGNLASARYSDVVRHYGAAIRSFEENMPDFIDQEGWSQARVKKWIAKYNKAERILAAASKQLKRIGL